MNEAQRLWDECAGILRGQVSEPVWLTSFEAAHAVSLDGSVLTVAVPSFLAKERIEGRYMAIVRDALLDIGADHLELAIEVAPAEPEPAWTVEPRPSPPPRRAPPRRRRPPATAPGWAWRPTTSTPGTRSTTS